MDERVSSSVDRERVSERMLQRRFRRSPSAHLESGGGDSDSASAVMLPGGATNLGVIPIPHSRKELESGRGKLPTLNKMSTVN
jgi:hypothetical protein